MSEYNLDIDNMSPAEFSSINKANNQIVDEEEKKAKELKRIKEQERLDYLAKLKRAHKGR